MKNRAYMVADYRERYAMEHGKKTTKKDHRGHVLWVYRYSVYDSYQDANGAIYDATEGRWVK